MKAIWWIIGICWVVFWVYWLAAGADGEGGRTRWGQWTGRRLGIVVVIMVLANLCLVRYHVAPAGGLWLAVFGLVVCLAGLALAVWARVCMGDSWGMPMAENANVELVTAGPYSFVRHPIYTGMIAGMAGTVLAVSLWDLILIAVLGGYFGLSAVSEERYMTSRFPDAYPGYKRATKMLIPCVLLSAAYRGDWPAPRL